MTPKRLVFSSIALGFATSVLLDAAGRWLPYSTTRDAITDALSLPGGIAAGFLFPEGIHGDSAVAWALLAMFTNQLVFVLFWYGVLALWKYLARRARTA